MKFRALKAEEIEVRVGNVAKDNSYLTLLLYKDARVDMQLLDETVGAENWQRKHEIINGIMFCTVGIKINEEWIYKQDAGAESNIEKEKGACSDSFKRACTNWGIGRELYTAPKIFIPSFKGTKYDRYKVSRIKINKGIIEELEIVNASHGNGVIFIYPEQKKTENRADQEQPPQNFIENEQINELRNMLERKAVYESTILKTYNVNKLEELTQHNFQDAMIRLSKNKDRS